MSKAKKAKKKLAKKTKATGLMGIGMQISKTQVAFLDAQAKKLTGGNRTKLLQHLVIHAQKNRTQVFGSLAK